MTGFVDTVFGMEGWQANTPLGIHPISSQWNFPFKPRDPQTSAVRRFHCMWYLRMQWSRRLVQSQH